MLAEEPEIETKIREIVNSRNEKLVLEEKMVNMDQLSRQGYAHRHQRRPVVARVGDAAPAL